jgi:DNA transposition AAA+ family ATPase
MIAQKNATTAAPPEPAWRTMTMSERDEIIRQMVAIQLSENLSNKVIGSILGCSKEAWSSIKNGNYKGLTDKYLSRAKQWMTERLTRKVTPPVDFVETSYARYIMAVCKRAWEKPTMGLVILPSGFGKSSALRYFARLGQRDVTLVYAAEYISGIAGILGEIARRLGLPKEQYDGATIDTVSRNIRENLTKRNQGGKKSPHVILVDEAQNLSLKCLNALRNLHDDPACSVAIVLADTWRLDSALRNPHGIAGGTEQLKSRCGAVYMVPESDSRGKPTQVSDEDVRLVAEATMRSLRHFEPITDQALKYLVNIANAPGAARFRGVVTRIQDVARVAEQLGVEAAYDVHQLDYVAPLSGGECESKHTVSPFETAWEKGLGQTATGAA